MVGDFVSTAWRSLRTSIPSVFLCMQSLFFCALHLHVAGEVSPGIPRRRDSYLPCSAIPIEFYACQRTPSLELYADQIVMRHAASLG